MIRRIFHDIGREEETGLEAFHEFLVEGSDFDAASARVNRFLEQYQLVRYGSIEILGDRSVGGESSSFDSRLRQGVKENRSRVRAFIEELRGEGIAGLEELAGLGQGHLSKTVHTVAHLLDGFFGIDSFFFNLVEDSHWVSEETMGKIAGNPGKYMIVAVRARV